MRTLISLLPILPILLQTVPSLADLKLIQDTCKKSCHSSPNINYNFCVSSLLSDKKSVATDVQGLCVISAQLTLANATQALADINQLLMKTCWAPFEKDCLKACQEAYSNAVGVLSEAAMAFQLRRYRDANVFVSSAMDDSAACEDGFEEKPGHMSPLRKHNDNLFELGAIALAITHILA